MAYAPWNHELGTHEAQVCHPDISFAQGEDPGTGCNPFSTSSKTSYEVHFSIDALLICGSTKPSHQPSFSWCMQRPLYNSTERVEHVGRFIVTVKPNFPLIFMFTYPGKIPLSSGYCFLGLFTRALCIDRSFLLVSPYIVAVTCTPVLCREEQEQRWEWGGGMFWGVLFL